MSKYAHLIAISMAIFSLLLKSESYHVHRSDNLPPTITQQDLAAEITELQARNILIKMAAEELKATTANNRLRLVAENIHQRHTMLQVDIAQLGAGNGIDLPTILPAPYTRHLDQCRKDHQPCPESRLLQLIADQKIRMQQIVRELNRSDNDQSVRDVCKRILYSDLLRYEGIAVLAGRV